MRINPIIYGLLVVIVFLGVILGFQTVGIWSISGKADSSGQAIQPSASDVATIKGWMTFSQISTTYNVSLEEIIQQFQLPVDTQLSTSIKDLESEKFDAGLLGDWLQGRNQTEDSIKIDVSSSASIKRTTGTPGYIVPEGIVPTEHVVTEKTVTGNTTFQDLLDWGVPAETIRQIIGNEIPADSTKIKDYAIEKDLEFSTLKTEFQIEADKTE